MKEKELEKSDPGSRRVQNDADKYRIHTPSRIDGLFLILNNNYAEL